MRKNSFAFCGGAYGDEGKGRIVDEYVNTYLKKGPVIVYRDNGGANAGHTVELANGKRVAFHQLPSGIFHKKAVVILGKGMVIHPGDLLEEIKTVEKITKKLMPTIMIDEMATLSLDTHRAYESALKSWQEGGKGATGRGISPAYADILLRHPIRMRDLVAKDTKIVSKHYQLYKALLTGLGVDIANVEIPTLHGEPITVGSERQFVSRVMQEATKLKKYVSDVSQFVEKTWSNPRYTYIFEKAQAVGLDYRWGVYPDVTASDTTFDGIFSATEGSIDPSEIQIRAGVIKATYMSSVGARILPTKMDETLAVRIREDAYEYGATTKRPRGIAYLDIPALSYFCTVGKMNRLILTHMDVIYPDASVKVCVAYKKNGHGVPYRPDQKYLLTVKPIYKEFEPWDKKEIQKAKSFAGMPLAAKKFLRFMENAIGAKIFLVTTGPRCDQSIQVK